MTTTTLSTRVDAADVELKVKDMYTRVALNPEGRFHFEMGRAMARRIGYTDTELDGAPDEAVESFAGVGYYFDLADLRPGEDVVDLGSGSGMDSFIAAHKVGRGGHVTGIDMTDAQLAKAERLRHEPTFGTVRFCKASIDATGLPGASCDAVISNGVINLSPDKLAVFREAARLLRPGGRLAIADIVTDMRLPEDVSPGRRAHLRSAQRVVARRQELSRLAAVRRQQSRESECGQPRSTNRGGGRWL